MESEGVNPSAIDQAALDFGMPMGPIALADTVGLDICLSVAEILSETLSIEIPDRLRELVADGHLGKKSGKGFYRYKNDKPDKPVKEKSRSLSADIQDRLILRMLNEAQACLREGVVSNSELLDAGVIFGTGFAPFRGGPMHYIDQKGADALLTKIQSMHERYGERFRPDEYWDTSINP
jgi:3-hydroxyacyl-CoA dehydrogenase/enoyl-CoA hydratase/3-hydroxybutyryl-CoA epimerase